ncbi:MAG: hypothetical protein FJW30_28455 [Acidobacteria bacterium]|nr:hypothetical protein [Acidobacteriota bacterium]
MDIDADEHPGDSHARLKTEMWVELPAGGAGGVFPNQKSTFTGRTNLQGQVRAPYLMNAVAGEFTIRVSAAIGDRKGSVSINQTHSLQTPEQMSVKKKRWYKDWRILAAGGGAAAVGIILGTRGGSSSNTPAAAPPPTITITPGGPTLGGPR